MLYVYKVYAIVSTGDILSPPKFRNNMSIQISEMYEICREQFLQILPTKSVHLKLAYVPWTRNWSKKHKINPFESQRNQFFETQPKENR